MMEAPYVVLQFDVVNTIPEQALRNVRVQVDTAGQVSFQLDWLLYYMYICVYI